MGSDKPKQKKSEKAASRPFPEDYKLVQLIIARDVKTWEDFYSRHKSEIINFIKKYSPGTFTETDVEIICENVLHRIMANDFKALRIYNGDCPFRYFLARQVKWACLDYIKKCLPGFKQVSRDDLAKGEMEESSQDNRKRDKEELSYGIEEKISNKILDAVLCMNDPLRWAFLLRYYDYFDFPGREIRLLSQRRGISIREMKNLIVKLLDRHNNRLLESRRNKQHKLEETIEKLCDRVQMLQDRYDKSMKELTSATSGSSAMLNKKKERFLRLEKELEGRSKYRDRLIKQLEEGHGIVKTPYEIIAEILGANTITIRTWMMKAQQQLEQNRKRSTT